MAKRRTQGTARNTSSSPNTLPLPDKGVGSVDWFVGEVEESSERLTDLVRDWKQDLDTYNGAKPKLSGINDPDVVNVNVPFYVAEGKQPNLFYTTPFVQVEGRMEETRVSAPMVQAIINAKLGRSEINAAALMDELLKDMLVTAGMGVSKIGYERVDVDVEIPKIGPLLDPMGQPQIDLATGQPMQGPQTDPVTGKPIMIPTKKKIYSRIYWNRISPANLRLPVGFTSQRYDDAPWIGWVFPLPARVMDDHSISAASVPGMSKETSLMDERDAKAFEDVPMGIEIWYKAYLFDPAERNPERIRQLVIAPGKTTGRGRGTRGEDRVLVHRDSPWQVFDENGAFKTGMRGYPIHIITLRTRPESAFPKSDARVLRDVAIEKSLGRSLMVEQRRRNLPMMGVDKTRVVKDTLDQLEKGMVQRIILFNGPVADQFQALDRSPFPAENFEFDRIAQQDIDRLSAAGANQQSLAGSSDTATEASYIQRAYDNRLSKERERCLGGFLDGVEKVFALFQLFSDEREAIEIVGADGMKELKTWNKLDIQGRFGFSLKPDSSERTNAAEERGEALKMFNLLVNAPGANVIEMMRGIVKRFNEDPTKLVLDAPPPPPPPAKLALSISINPSMDLNPASPGYAATVELLKLAGINLPQPAAPITSPEGVPPVNQHQANLTGRMAGVGPL